MHYADRVQYLLDILLQEARMKNNNYSTERK